MAATAHNFQNVLGFAHDMINCKAKLLQQIFDWRGCAEVATRDHATLAPDVLFPAQAGAGFYNAINGSISAYSELFVDGTPFLINDAVHGVTRNVFSA